MRFIKLIPALGLLFAALPAQASTSSNGHVLSLASTPQNVMFLFADGTGRVLPSCANAGFPTRWAFDISTDRGKAMASLLMTSLALGKSVTIIGTGDCTPGWSGGDLENVSSVYQN